MKKTFLAIYNATEGVIKGEKQRLVKQRNERAVSSAIDSAIDQKLTAEEDLDKQLAVVAKGSVIDVNEVLRLRQVINNTDNTIEALEEFKAEFFSDEEPADDAATAEKKK